jgi:hypothetical protein
MTARGQRAPIGPRIGEEFGWRQVNGWEKLRRVIGKIPNAIPHVVSLVMDAPHSGQALTEVESTGTVLIPPECEFYCLATSVAGNIPGASSRMFPGSSTARFQPEGLLVKVLIQYESGGFRWSNAPVQVGHLFGDWERPYYWPAPWIIPGGTQIKATVFNRENAAQTTRYFFNFIGFKMFNTDPPLPTDFLLSPRILDVVRRAKLSQGSIRVEPYVYALNFDTLGNVPSTFGPRVAHGAEQQTFSVADADFAIVDQMGQVNGLSLDDGSGSTLPDFNPGNTVKLTLDVGRRRVDDRALPLVSIFGSAREPFRYAYPLVVTRGGNLTALVSFFRASSQNAYLTFSGVRIFPGGFR